MIDSKAKILVVDDEPSIRDLLKLNLETGGFEVALADTGLRGMEIAAEFHPHLIVLDLGLPDVGGLEVLKRLREWTTIPIVILTVTDDDDTKVSLLDAGADDYLVKPFSMSELMARIRVALRHHGNTEATPVFNSGNLMIDLNARLVTVSGQAVKLTATEYKFLSLLVRNHGKVVSQKQLLLSVWGAGASDQAHYLRIYVAHLRKKLEDDPSTPTHILNEPGVGYRIV